MALLFAGLLGGGIVLDLALGVLVCIVVHFLFRGEKPEEKKLAALTGNVLLIIDGSNGPIRLTKDHRNKGTAKSKNNKHEITLLNVKNGENMGDSIDLVPSLQSCLATHHDLFEASEIFFDGLGMRRQEVEGQDSIIAPFVTLRVTPKHEEADLVILNRVEDRQNNDLKEETPIPISLRAIDDAISTDEEQICRQLVYTILRNQDGPGKARQVLKPYTLFRAESVFCLFGFQNCKALLRDVRRLGGYQYLFASVDQQSLGDQGGATLKKKTIVVSDDVYLRQRVIDRGGFVLTFEQLWEVLKEE